MFTSIKVYSLLGQEVLNVDSNDTSNVQINVSKLSVGTYFVKVIADTNTETFKIIKK